jgi:hypothetical protein
MRSGQLGDPRFGAGVAGGGDSGRPGLPGRGAAEVSGVTFLPIAQLPFRQAIVVGRDHRQGGALTGGENDLPFM